MSVTKSLDRSLDELKAKFLRLLETDRQSEEFKRLYHEVDSELGGLARAAEADITKAS